MERRTFLQVAGIAPCLFATGSLSPIRGKQVESRSLRPQSIGSIEALPEPEALGRKYLSKCPEERSLGRLGELLSESAPTSGDVSGSGRTGRPKSHAQLNRQIRLDYEKGRTVVLDGWVLSRSEARQCARLALLGRTS